MWWPSSPGAIALVVGINVPISGLVAVGVATIAGGIVIIGFAQGMPSVTMPGAMVRAMLAAYRRTLHKTMEQARSMQQVVDEAGLDWLETPDQAVVWGTALGLQGDIEDVLERSIEDVRAQPSMASATYFPAWYSTSDGSSMARGMAAGSGASIFSGSAVPDLGGMMSALGTIGNSPASSGSVAAAVAGSAAARRAAAEAARAAASSRPRARASHSGIGRLLLAGSHRFRGHQPGNGVCELALRVLLDVRWLSATVRQRSRTGVGRLAARTRLGRRSMAASLRARFRLGLVQDPCPLALPLIVPDEPGRVGLVELAQTDREAPTTLSSCRPNDQEQN